ncbi:MAG: hypothetical protein ACI4VF_00355 [Lachnospirales bacterium]
MKHIFKKGFFVFSVCACLVFTGCGNSVKKISLPTDEEMQQAGMGDITQTDEIKDFVLSDYSISNGEIVYSFSNVKDEKNTLEVKGVKMSLDEYNESLPKSDNLKDTTINGMECKFIDRTVHYVPDGYEFDERVKNNIKNGTTEAKYGSPSNLDQLLPLQRIYWYDAVTSTAYTLEAMGEYYTLENMSEYVYNYVDNAK